MGIRGFFQTLFKNGVHSAYNSVKDRVGNVYSGVRNAVHKVGDTINSIDRFISDVRGKNLPAISNIAEAVQSNPYYRAVLTGSKKAEEYVDTAGQIGKAVDSVLDPATQGIDMLASKLKKPQTPASPVGVKRF